MNSHARLIRAIVLLGLLVLPASASANVISSNDFDGIRALQERTFALFQETNALWAARGTPEAMRHCLFDLSESLDKFSDDLGPLVRLVLLASKMVDVTDEKAVIHILSVEALYFLQHLEGRRKGIDALLTMPGLADCPQNSIVVADTAHKILRIYSEAATVVGSIVKKIGASSPR